VGENNLDVLLIQRKYVEPHVEKGIFNWDSFEDSGQFIFLPSNESIELEVNPTTLFDVYIILVRISESIDLDSDALGEVRISAHYVDDKLLWTGLLVSLPAFIITGIVLEGAINLRRNQSKL
jgi:hypothetical protein